MANLIKFLKEWMLVIGIVCGASLYIIFHYVTLLHPAGPFLLGLCRNIQPVLIFAMLFLTFCRIEPHELRPHRWQLWLLLIQGGSFVLVSLLIVLFPALPLRIGWESFMLCMICPTATACAVVTNKLGGSMSGVLTYTILINLLTAILVPLFVPLIQHTEGMNFFTAFSRILAKVFPLLILPALSAWLIRYLLPELHSKLSHYTNLSFYVWAVALLLAILMSTRAIFHHDGSVWDLLEIAVASLLSSVIQFGSGKLIGAYYDRKTAAACNNRITAGQALGQKNTVFGIWMGYTFLNPVTSLAGGFYSIWHNVYNTMQLREISKRKPD